MVCFPFSPSLDQRLSLSLALSFHFTFGLIVRWSMIVGGSFYAIVVASNLISNSVVQIIANCVVGVGAAMIWNAQGVYLGRCALLDSRTSTKSLNGSFDSCVGFAETTSSFNGIFFSIFQFSGMAGTLIGGIISQFGSKTVYPSFLSYIDLIHRSDNCWCNCCLLLSLPS